MLHITLWLSLLKSFCNINRYLTYTTIACRMCFSQSVIRSDSFDWQNTQEKDSSVITAHESTKRLTLALGIFKLHRITWPFLWKVIEYKIIMCFIPPCRREKNTDDFTVSISFEYELERVVVVNNIYTFYWNNYKL
jgi:hypothetical protein